MDIKPALFNKRFLFALFLTVYSQLGKPALLTLPQSPIGLSNAVVPNVMFDLDDSGSMDWEYLGRLSWEGCAYDPNFTGTYSAATSCGSQWSGDPGMRAYTTYNGGQYLFFNYIYNNADNLYGNSSGCGLVYNAAGLNSVLACPGASQDWRFFCPDQNLMYYDPDSTYTPWLANCTSGTACANASFTAALSYPASGQQGYSLSTNLAPFTYQVWIDDHGYSGTRPLIASAVNATTGANGMVDLWDSHVAIVLNANNTATVTTTTYAPTSAGLNPTVKTQATLSGNACYNVLGPTALVQSIFAGSLGYTSTGASGCQTIAQAQQNVANWYQYYRRRALAVRGTLATIVNQYPNLNYGLSTINNNIFITVPPAGTTNFSTYNSNLISSVVNYQWSAIGTPSRSGLAYVGQYYQNKLSGNANPITQACQQNYTIFMTDGYWDTGDSLPSGIADCDGDGISQTFADVACYYYNNNLQPSFTANQVIPYAGWSVCGQTDIATWLHMVTYTVGFGVAGNLTAGTDGWPSPCLTANGNWGNPFNTQAAKADDLWHAAFDSRGAYLAAQNPGAAAQYLGNFLSNILVRSSSFTSVAQNSTVLNSNAVVYQAIVNGTVGDLLAYPISTTGSISTTANWSANCLLTGGDCSNPAGTNTALAPSSRVIITRNWTGTNTGMAFEWPTSYTSYKSGNTYPTNLTNFMAKAPYSITTTKSSQITANNTYGSKLVGYLRGVRSNEVQNGGTLRNRSGVLGDIIDSPPLYVPAPYRNYPDTLETSPYSTFKSANASRTPIIYVGANDGMLHGFNANTGSEVLGYIPGIRQIYQNLPNLSLTTYTHNFFVDGSPVEGDVYTNGAWRTMLVTTLRNGGQGITALDITNPANFTEANASSIYLWEFTDQDDPDVGYVYGPVSIAKVLTSAGTSEWAVIFGNGYNSSQSDGYASTTGKATLFVLLIGRFSGTWTLNTNYYKISVGAGTTTTPSGLAAPFVIDTNGDFVANYAYAGDQQGNMWRFNLSGGTPANWSTSATNIFTASYATAGDQPITAQPVVGPHPNGISNGVLVYFGTGKFLQQTDNSTTGQVTQAFYGIWDTLSATTAVAKSSLVQQQILGEATATGGSYRLVTSNTINWNPTPSPQNFGWYINLIENTASSNNGERVISQAILRNGNVIFTTLIPSVNACVPGGSSWLMELNAATGGAPLLTPFDTTNDGIFSTADYLSITQGGKTYTVPASGLLSKVGMIGAPTILLSSSKTTETKVLSGSQGLGTVNENAQNVSGRQNWRQLF